jgi:formamidopyrimidine-DNA glycosylase
VPELPDVEIFRKYFNRTSLNKKVEKVEVAAERMLQDVSPRSLQLQLKNSIFTNTSRHAKYLFAHTDDNKLLVLHFGMTGSLHYFKNEEEKPGHTAVQIIFKNGYHLAFDCPRKLGKIYLINDKHKFIEKKKLGPDPFADNINLAGFRKILKGKRGSIKTALMDQKTIGGIGNLYSDEILFNAGIHPVSKTEKLNDNQVKKIYGAMNRVLHKAIDVKADITRMPKTFLLLNREAGVDCPGCGGKISKMTIGGRTSYFCAKHQKRMR